MEIALRTLTPVWTGGADQTADRLHESGLIGSIRWWYEALVRGLGGYACDPTSDDRCPDKDGKRCAACELFGCTGWARKFRLRVLDSDGQVIQNSLAKDTDFVLEFRELREMNDAEKWLLSKAVWIAGTYGALGGKTTLKPQKDARKGADNGIVHWKSGGSGGHPDTKSYLDEKNWRKVKMPSPNLRTFLFVKGAFLWRTQMNHLVGLSEDGKKVTGNAKYQSFLRGERGQGNDAAISKKIFSFRADGGRIWGYAHDAAMRDEIIRHIKTELGDRRYTVKTGEEVLHEL